jgi:hypothetical protein
MNDLFARAIAAHGGLERWNTLVNALKSEHCCFRAWEKRSRSDFFPRHPVNCGIFTCGNIVSMSPLL